ncbi:hypothetical protein Q0812_03665 [Brevundimonas sp. 2R-24]|uniref:Uncharacterized protein n=1 Tax=Peiella sedimenti TaxID=3061083 RepID=A0ABT8SIX8_9CAUL|nr:hypothetical protein [Caulobacteraceae bacterium XZ-24]
MRRMMMAMGCASAALILASAANAQDPGDPGTRTDDHTCMALAMEANEAAENNMSENTGRRYGSGEATPAEREYKQECMAPTTSRMYSSTAVTTNENLSSTTVSGTTGVGTPILPPRTELITNGPVPDTPANRARYGGPNSRAGQMTAPRGN